MAHHADPFQAIADPSRREILFLLSNERLTINALAENFDMSRPAVSKHIKILHEAGFIAITEQGRERYCTLNRDGFSGLQDWINYFDGFWKQKLGNLDKLLAAKTKKNK
jgi:DNA-binding transcriptional ArsR family regulator